ncbi:MAG: BrnT family toxin [Bryobacteraceae bacterium]
MADDPTFEWDEANIQHIARHNVKPSEVEQVFWNDPDYVNYELVNDEPRWTMIGHTSLLRVLFIVWTARQNTRIRTITARDVPVRTRIAYFMQRGVI